jgi:hypothetical protein
MTVKEQQPSTMDPSMLPMLGLSVPQGTILELAWTPQCPYHTIPRGIKEKRKLQSWI